MASEESRGADRHSVAASDAVKAGYGVVLLSLQGQFVGVPQEHLRSEMRGLVEAMTRGALAALDAVSEADGEI